MHTDDAESAVANSTRPKPLTKWYGGTARLAGVIAQMTETIPHAVYGEPYMGMAAVLMHKKRSKVEVLNDRFGGLVDLFRVVRDPLLCAELVRRLRLTPYARDEWRACYRTWKGESDLVGTGA